MGFSTTDAKKLYENPEHREKMHHASIVRSAKPEFRQKVSQGVRHKIQTDPAFAKQWKEKSKTMDIETYRSKAKSRWQDSEYRKHQMEARQNSPKVLENCRKMREKIRPVQERTVMSPDGTIHTFLNAKQFSETHQLSYDAFLKLLLGKQRQHRGWKLYNPL
jgi:ribosomal protein L19E